MKKITPSFISPDIKCWPEFRWWLAEGFHTDETLKNDVKMIYDSGFGAVEILSLDDPGADSKRYGWSSEEWIHDQTLLLEETTKRGMGFSMTSGANWSNANLVSITPDDYAASKELDYVSIVVGAGETWKGELPKVDIRMPNVHQQVLIAVVAGKLVGKKDSSVLLDKESLTTLTAQVVGDNLCWTAPDDGEYELFFFWMHGTGQTAKPTAKTSYTINYIDKYGVQAWIEYWNNQMLTKQAKTMIKESGRVQIYMDSLELNTYGKVGQFWGYHFLEEFYVRRGYDLTIYLPLVIRLTSSLMYPKDTYTYAVADEEFSFKLYNDLYQTMTDLYIHNTLVPLNNWLHSMGMGIRAEISYCMPFEISQPGFAVDGIETESFEFASQIDCFRGMAGAAHIYNKMYSSETGCAMQNFKKGLDFYDQIMYTQFAAGVTRTVLHGYSSIAGSEEATQWPGHEGMMKVFGERFGCRQPAYSFYKEWSKMISRFQYVLRQGKPRMDLGILRLDYRFDPMKFVLDENESYNKMWMRSNVGIYWKDTTLQNNGYTYDYFAPQLLADVDFENGEIAPLGPGYQALIIYQEAFPYESALRILEWTKQGLPVVFVNGVTESVHTEVDVTHRAAACKTPFNDQKDEALAEVISQIKACDNVREINDPAQAIDALQEMDVYPRIQMSRPSAKLLPLMRQDEDNDYIYLYNCMFQDEKAENVFIRVKGIAKPYKLDCWSGEINEVALYRYEGDRTVFEVSVAPGEAVLFSMDRRGDIVENHVVCSDADLVMKRGDQTEIIAFSSGSYITEFSNGHVVTNDVMIPKKIDLNNWTLKVEDWNEGEKKIIEEDRGLGYITREAFYETRKDIITVEATELKPWKDIEEVGEAVAGIGHYCTNFMLPETWTERYGTFLKIGKTGGNPVIVAVNGKQTPPVNSKTMTIDVSALLRAGENSLQIDVPTPLNNRLLNRNYFRAIAVEMTVGPFKARCAQMGIFLPTEEEVLAMTDNQVDQFIATFPLGMYASIFRQGIHTSIQDNGLVGKVELIPYSKVLVN